MASPFLEGINSAIDILLIGLFLIGLFIWNARSLAVAAKKEVGKESKRIEWEKQDKAGKGKSDKEKQNTSKSAAWISGIGKAFYTWLIFVILQIIIIAIFWSIPDILVDAASEDVLISAGAIRWVLLYITLGPMAYLYTRKHGGLRGVVSMLAHLSLFLLGWLSGRWFGIMFISIPMLAIYYYLIYRFAEVIIPASDPESRPEKFQRFKILAGYMWGIQFPVLVIDDQTGMKVETRIEGDMFQDIELVPGYIWTHMPQAVGITSGTNFARVEGPGAIYTHKYERPLDVVDLRTQLRTTEVETITQDGIPIRAIVFMSFRLDNTNWDRSLYNRLKLANPLLRGGITLDRGNNHFRYSSARVRAALSMEGVRTNVTGPVGSVSWRWDEQVVYMVAEAARRVISEIPLAELWVPSPERDGEGISALDVIADKIKDEKNPNGLFGTLQKNGVLLYAARVVNYFSHKDNPKSKELKDKFGEFTYQQIPTWRVHWEQQINKKLTEASAEAEQKQMDATALARSKLLRTIATTLQKTSTHNKDLPRYLIAIRFLSALDDMISQDPTFATNEKGQALRERIAWLRSLPHSKE